VSLFVVGVDLGQAQDYTAICVVEARGTEYLLRHLERLALGTLYPRIVQRVEEIVRRLPSADFQLAVDATGVGQPVVDLLEQAGLEPVGVIITGGDTVQREGRRLRVPKRDLVAVLTIVFQAGQLKIAETLPLAGVFAKELLSFKVKIDVRTAHDTYGAWREGEHDDLVLAVAIAVWTARSATGRQISVGAVEL